MAKPQGWQGAAILGGALQACRLSATAASARAHELWILVN